MTWDHQIQLRMHIFGVERNGLHTSHKTLDSEAPEIVVKFQNQVPRNFHAPWGCEIRNKITKICYCNYIEGVYEKPQL